MQSAAQSVGAGRGLDFPLLDGGEGANAAGGARREGGVWGPMPISGVDGEADGGGCEGRCARLALQLFFAASFVVAAACMVLTLSLLVLLLLDSSYAASLRGSWAVLTVFVAYCALVGVFGVLLAVRATAQPVRARSPAFLAISTAGGAALASWVGVGLYRWGDAFSECHRAAAALIVAYPCFILPYFFRAYRLWYCFRVNEEAFKEERPFTHERHRATQRHLLKWFAVGLVCFAAAASVHLWSHVDVFPLCQRRGQLFYSVFWIAAHALEALLFVFCIAAVRHVWDMYSIRAELQAVAGVTLVYALLLVVFLALSSDRDVAVETGLLSAIRVLVCFIVSVMWPVYRSLFRSVVVLEIARREQLGSLRQVLDDPKCFPYFQRFAVADLSAELLKFWVECQLFAEDVEPSQRRAEALRILDEYDARALAAATPHLDALRRRALAATPAAPLEADAFAKAQADVLRFMERALYPRFLESEHCAELLAEMDRTDVVVNRLVSNKLI